MMSEKETDPRDDVESPEGGERPSAEESEHPVPGVKHEREPDAENIMPAEDRPGTL